MRSQKILVLMLTFVLSTSLIASEFKIESYKLKNGLTVILNEDHSQQKVFGTIAVNAGAVNDPEDATGLAHYLEHVMFNGTANVGTINWQEEKVHYEKVIALFEELRQTNDEEERNQIIKKINEVSLEQGKYFQTKEFVLLLESIGATGINAATSYDYTFFFSTFPTSQSAAWLEIYANEFTNPVFRNFQAELETVYEEFNMGLENPMRNFQNVTFDNMYKGTPYGKSVIGYGEHLKSPSLQKLIDFYNTWYVPGNMALILVGDFNPESIKSEIEATFGQMEEKPLPNFEVEPIKLEKHAKVKIKQTPYTIGRWTYNAPMMGDDDLIKMQILNEVLSNSASIGLLDQLATDGDLMSVGSFYYPFKSAGMMAITAVPNFDLAQMRQLSTSEIDDLLFDKIDLIRQGKIDQKLLDAVRDNYIRDYLVMLEDFTARGQWLIDFFIGGRPLEDANRYLEKINEITIADLSEVANRYLNDVYLEISSTKGEIKSEEIEKPEIEPVLQTVEEASEFALKIQDRIANAQAQADFIDFKNDIHREQIADKVELYYKQNTQNDIFDLRIKYKVGTAQIPTLDFAAQLMNYAGVRGNYEPSEFKQKMGELGCSYRFSASENFLTVTISGREKNLEEACKLISMVTLIPDLDEKQYNSLIGGELNGRMVQKDDFQSLSNAAAQYLIYGENSPSIDRLTWDELLALDINQLTGEFIKATKYEALVHYYGSSTADEAKTKLLNNLAFAAGRLPASDYYVREISKPEENTIYVVNKPGTRQSNIYLMLPVTEQYNIGMAEETTAFSKYFGEGLDNIFFSEIREFRSMAYTASASVATPSVAGHPAYMVGYIGTQGDKTNDAVEVAYSLVREMPLKERKAMGVRNNLLYGSSLQQPTDRYVSYYIENYERQGYSEDPVKIHQAEFEKANIDYINEYYTKNIQSKPVSMIIVGDRKKVDKKLIETIGSYQNLSTDKLFSK